MNLHFRGWEQIVKTKTKPSSALAVLRWTLIQHVNRSLEKVPDDQMKKKALQQEMTWLNDYWGQAIPKHEISPKYWQRIFQIKSLATRRDLYEFLFDDEERQKRYRFRIRKRQEWLVKIANGETPATPWSQTIFGSTAVRYNPQRWNNLYALYRAARLGEYFVVDGGFEYAHARHSYLSSLVQRVFRCFRDIERFHSPSYIIITDLAENIQTSAHALPQEQSIYFHSTRKTYLDLFDRDRLVYLTPDSPHEMTHYDHNAIYILGGIYDDQNKEPLTYEKAVRQNIRHVRLPLEKYLTFHSTSSRALAFHEVYNILLTLKHSNNDWVKAFRYVPDRKIATRLGIDEEENQSEDSTMEDDDEIQVSASELR